LQKDRVCGGRLFGGQHEGDEKNGIENCCREHHTVETKSFMSCKERDRNYGKYGTPKRELKTRQAGPLDKKPASAPEESGGEDKEQSCSVWAGLLARDDCVLL
jgi:hypothetical protein